MLFKWDIADEKTEMFIAINIAISKTRSVVGCWVVGRLRDGYLVGWRIDWFGSTRVEIS